MNTSSSQYPCAARTHSTVHYTTYNLPMRSIPAGVYAELPNGEKALNITIHIIPYANGACGVRRVLDARGCLGVPTSQRKYRIDFSYSRRREATDSAQNGFEPTRAAWPNITPFQSLISTAPTLAEACSLQAICMPRAKPRPHGTASLSSDPSSIRPSAGA